MSYVDSQDLAREREIEAKRRFDEARDQRTAEMNARTVSGLGFFKDERRVHLDELVRADLQSAFGHIPPHELKANQDQMWARLQPILDEQPDRPLGVEALKELLAGAKRGPISDALADKLVDVVVSDRTAVYASRSSALNELRAVSDSVAKSRPKLYATLQGTGASQAVGMTRLLRTEFRQQQATSSATRRLLGR